MATSSPQRSWLRRLYEWLVRDVARQRAVLPPHDDRGASERRIAEYEQGTQGAQEECRRIIEIAHKR